MVKVLAGRPLGEMLMWEPVRGAEAVKKMGWVRALRGGGELLIGGFYVSEGGWRWRGGERKGRSLTHSARWLGMESQNCTIVLDWRCLHDLFTKYLGNSQRDSVISGS